MLVELSSVAFRYGRRDPWVLQNVTVRVPRGRIIEVTGPNGAGKSTLLRLIAGILRPARGRSSAAPPGDSALPAVALHIALWTAVVGQGYVLVRRRRV